MAESTQENSLSGTTELSPALRTGVGKDIWNVIRDAQIVFPYTAEDAEEKTGELRAVADAALADEASYLSEPGVGLGHFKDIVAEDPLAVATVYQLDQQESLAGRIATVLQGPVPATDSNEGMQDYGKWYGAVEDLLPRAVYFSPTPDQVAIVRASWELSRQIHRDAGLEDHAALIDRVLQGGDQAEGDLYRAQLRARSQLIGDVLQAAGIHQPAN